MSRATTSGSTQIYASGQQNYSYNTLFDVHSTSVHSHPFKVDNNFFRVQAFNLSGSETVTLEQITNAGQSNQIIAPYAPVSGPVTLTTSRTSYIVERPGDYRLTLSGGGLGTVVVVGFQFAMENEASQDIADALYAVLTSIITPNPCTIGAAIPEDTTANNNVVSLNSSDCLVDQQLMSSAADNLLQLRDDGLFYGITPPDQFLNQYVSSSTGNDSNAGTIGSPLKTIAKAISNLPDGTMGNIFLLAGDTFYNYQNAPSDTFNTLTLNQTFNAINGMDIGNRLITISPYNDVPITTINAYNVANSTGYDAYIAAETNFPTIVANISLTTNTAQYLCIPFTIGINGLLTIKACVIRTGQTGTVGPTITYGFFRGSGTVFVHGGKIVLGSSSIFKNISPTGVQLASITNLQVEFAPVPSNPSTFCNVGTYYTYTTGTPFAAGGLIVPSLTYTNIGDNVETFLAHKTLWPGIVVYPTDSAGDELYRSYRHVLTSIAIDPTT